MQGINKPRKLMVRHVSRYTDELPFVIFQRDIFDRSSIEAAQQSCDA